MGIEEFSDYAQTKGWNLILLKTRGAVTYCSFRFIGVSMRIAPNSRIVSIKDRAQNELVFRHVARALVTPGATITKILLVCCGEDAKESYELEATHM
jgi:hypothetical protein